VRVDLGLLAVKCESGDRRSQHYWQAMPVQFPTESGRFGWKMWPMFSQHWPAATQQS
jgi:hypothetical protein